MADKALSQNPKTPKPQNPVIFKFYIKTIRNKTKKWGKACQIV